ncbi:LysR family glycine cleavage system transcriptional activator/LysR family transcriptional regulator of beta-lactamase [Hoeflea marina]|uniref:LysR family glycine cleavage system transcriptional activator/LysR family transcriptional regulator of beta-lactamase n=1 Tax=Hoeflea marina TaxID=274592 RepID=A0A317PQP2_9HYPH|nr:LysR family transcriptional regulator [Hoeflea marina]PWW03783.1 LysR family glycine cleavage system transcriptional activator/LysR family transcriptional regulator of beta-lactamase [Hoeflea marina]
MQIYSFSALRAFETAARHGTFVDAARELNVTRPAISKQIRLLEAAMDCRLFDRSSAGCQLTRDGQELYSGLRQAFDLIAVTTQRIAERGRHDNKVRVLVERDFASSWLAERIGQFLIANPGISIEITAEKNGRLNMSENFSFRIFYGENGCFEGDELVAETLCNWIDIPVCTAAYGLRHVAPDGSLKAAHFLIDGNYDPWKHWFDVAGIEAPGPAASHTTFNETTLCLSAAIAGTGITIGDSFLCLSAIQSGQLIAPVKVGMRSYQNYAMYRPRGVRLSPAEERFRQWLLRTVAQYNLDVEEKFVSLGIRVMEPRQLA